MAWKKTLIVQELKSRLSNWYLSQFERGPHVYMGFPEVEVTTFPSVWLFEGEETAVYSNVRRRGIYEFTFPLVIEFFFRPNRPQDYYDEARDFLYNIRQAVEKGLTFDDGTGACLAHKYYMTRNETVLFRKDVADLVIEYEFQYTDSFFGNNQ